MQEEALDLIPIGCYVVDSSGCISGVNALGAAIIGADVSSLLGEPFESFLDSESTRRCAQHFRVAANSGQRETVRVELVHGDGYTFQADLFTLAELDRNGVVVCFRTAIVTVAAELMKAKEEAEQMSRLKTAFLANMSHEIRTPLTGIIGFASVLAKELPHEQGEFAELIRASGRRLMEMLNSVLDLAKLESNQMNLETERIELLDEIAEVVDLLAPSAKEKGLRITMSVDEGPASIQSDRGAVNRILYNLIGNAIKFTNRGEITIRVWGENGRAGFEIIDTGIGIESKFLPHLFEEFRQESYGPNRSHGGTGLGLAITKRLVDLVDGEISVDSRKGVGTSFRVTFPRSEDEHAQDVGTPREATVTGPKGAKTLHVLLVEDNPDTQQLLLELLEEIYDVTVVGDAPAAFLAATRKEFDVILMDIDLGDGPDGIELLKQIRGVPEYTDVPIVAVTAYALPGDKERLLEQGFTAYVSKPFDVDELLQLPMQFS